ncbi:MAG TPA: hypothetical protein DCP63_06995 [Bacteroidetes bacterium]|nr:hypothetical protein [Bacteroidota bacterium]
MELKTKTFLFIISSFLLGGVAGGFVGKTYFGDGSGPRRPGRAEYQKQFADRLKLSSVQAAQVDSMFESNRARFSDVQKQYSEAIRLRRDTLRLEIRKLLSPEQNKLYDDYIKELEERDTRRRDRRD